MTEKKDDFKKLETNGKEKKTDLVKRITKIVLVLSTSIFIWYLFADRYTHYTDQVKIKILVVPLVPRVSGHLTDVNVRLYSSVEEGQILFQIDKTTFELAVLKAEADLGAQLSNLANGFAGLGVQLCGPIFNNNNATQLGVDI